MPTADLDQLLRDLAPQVVATVARRSGDFAAAEDATQEALVAAATQWGTDGLPDNPRNWLLTVAYRRLTDQQRSESARRRREEVAAVREPTDAGVTPGPGEDRPPDEDDTLTLLFLCCHPALTTPSQVALTLRAVGGLTTAEIANAFLVGEATMGQRISRAKQRITASGARFTMPPPDDLPSRVRAVAHVLYLIFNEGYVATAASALYRPDLTRWAITLTRRLHATRPDDTEVAGLLALMLLTEARRAARTTADGDLVPLDEQDRTRWDAGAITEGVALVHAALDAGRPGPYQVQAAIAALHAQAPDVAGTDWPQIRELYGVLRALDPSPAVALNEAVAVAMVHGPRAGLDHLADADGYRADAVRGHLLERAGEPAAAARAYRRAAGATANGAEKKFLTDRADRVEPGPPAPTPS